MIKILVILWVPLFYFMSLFQPPITQTRFDVIVYGGTSGGVTAAISAAREGLSVLLLEPENHIGGMTTSGLGYVDVGKSYTIGGITKQFFKKNGQYFKKNDAFYKVIPSVGEKIFYEMLTEKGVKVELNARLSETVTPTIRNKKIEMIELADGRKFSAKYFIDATYEGDLMAAAKVSYVVGRESSAKYNEPGAGVNKAYILPGSPYGADGKLLPDLFEGKLAEMGSADDKTQAYNFRLCLTQDKGNYLAIPKPDNYNPLRYEILLRIINTGKEKSFTDFVSIMPLPEGKSDFNNKGWISTDYVNGSWNYVESSYKKRKVLWNNHQNYTQGFMYFLGNDLRVPENIRTEALSWGLCKDEFKDNGNWPHQLYIREGRRMVGEYVMTQKDAWDQPKKEESVGMGSYMIDSHYLQRFVEGGVIKQEGLTGHQPVRPYEIPYRILTPKREECQNLLVPVCLSASHVMYGSLRMEPVYMILGESAGTAVALAYKKSQAVQDISVFELQKKLKAYEQILSYEKSGVYTKKDFKWDVLDDHEATFSGKWSTSLNSVPFMEGSGYRYVSDHSKPALATYKTTITKDDSYDILCMYSPGANRASNVKVYLISPEGKIEYNVNMKNNIPAEHYPFIKLATLKLRAGNDVSFQISNENANGLVIADAFLIKPSAL
jgi:hypothetical protein